jgi:hypothetical protein
LFHPSNFHIFIARFIAGLLPALLPATIAENSDILLFYLAGIGRMSAIIVRHVLRCPDYSSI